MKSPLVDAQERCATLKSALEFLTDILCLAEKDEYASFLILIKGQVDAIAADLAKMSQE